MKKIRQIDLKFDFFFLCTEFECILAKKSFVKFASIRYHLSI